MATLYIVATPIGNLADISLRALDVLRSVDVILCEDTRVTKKLLDRHQIKKPLLSYHQHSALRRLEEIAELLQSGKNIALVSDAGTPGISDPGGKLINWLTRKLTNSLNSLTITPVPGPNAAIAALSVAGFPADAFTFLGFPPTKKGRETFFRELLTKRETVVFYESPYRVKKTLERLAALMPERELVVLRELTKQFETIYRGKAREILERIRLQGEFVVVISPKS